MASSLVSSILVLPTSRCHQLKQRLPLLASATPPSTHKARFVARRKESVSVQQLQRPLIEYMRLPASQYSVLDAERIERVSEDTFRCYVYTIKFFTFEVCPVLLVKVEQQPNGCCIKLLSCKLQGSPMVAAQNDKFDAIMVNRISCESDSDKSLVQQLTSDTIIEVSIEIPFAFKAIPKQAIESAGTQVLEQILKIMLPRFMSQLVKDYQAWASGNASRQPLGTGEI
uniref:RAP annotation release 2, galactose-binding-like domain protein n=1 Tax=Medicago truncatula TaxID=3880 RepID=I3SZV9_MEDTR|nr:unknown [Medicago truncatula]